MNQSNTEANNSDQTPNTNLDKLGVFASALCVAHCLFTPLILTLIPVLNHQLIETQFHIYFGVIVSAIALLAFWRGYRLHHKKKILVMGSLGLAFLLSGLLSSALMAHSSHGIGMGFTLIGTLILMSAHLLNMRYCKDSCCTAHKCP